MGTLPRQSPNHFLQLFKFDMCVVAEGSEIVEPVLLGALMLSQRFVIFGDYYIKNPKCHAPDASMMQVSLMRRLAETYPQQAVTILRESHRLPGQVKSLLNKVAYRGLIKKEEVNAPPTEPVSINTDIAWVREALERELIWINTDNLLAKVL